MKELIIYNEEQKKSKMKLIKPKNKEIILQIQQYLII